MSERDRTPRRRSPSRQSRDQILVVCGGKTERDYFEGLRRLTRNAALTVKAKGVAPDQLVAYAERMRAQVPYDDVWCVTDVDQFDVVGAMGQAASAGINLAVSNPCFEVWLLLHFEDWSRPIHDYRAAARRLRTHLPGYSKQILFDSLAAGMTDAVRRARQLESAAVTNPSSSVWRLVDKLV